MLPCHYFTLSHLAPINIDAITPFHYIINIITITMSLLIFITPNTIDTSMEWSMGHNN